MPIISLANYEDREREFSLQLGRLLAVWAYIESSLLEYFLLMTRLDEKLGRAIFYSSRGYAARAEMLKAAIASSNVTEGIKHAAKAILTKADCYAALRNNLAHNLPIANATKNGAQIVLIEGGRQRIFAAGDGILLKHLEVAETNLGKLRSISYALLHCFRLPHPERIPGLLKELDLLPNEPTSLELSKKQTGRRLQRMLAGPKS